MIDALSNTPALAIGVALVLAAILATMLAWLLRGARFPGGAASSSILAGLIAGILLGPGVLGHVAPEAFSAAWFGASVEQSRFDQRLREARGAVAALEKSGVTGAAIDEYEQRSLAELEPLRDAVEIARVQRRGAWDFTLALAGASLLTLLPLGGISAFGGEINRSARRAAVLAGPASFLLAGAIVVVIVGAFTPVGWSLAALLFASVCACGWFAPPLDRLAHERTRATREAFVSGLFALGIAVSICLWTLPDRRAWFVSWGFIGAITLWCATRLTFPGRRARRVIHAIILGGVAPTVVALVAMRLDPIPLMHQREFWIALLAAAVACSDGRWFGAFLGAGLSGRARSVEIATAHTTAGVGLAQGALLAILAAGGPIDESLLGAGLLGALLVETCAGAYRWAGSWIERAAH